MIRYLAAFSALFSAVATILATFIDLGDKPPSYRIKAIASGALITFFFAHNYFKLKQIAEKKKRDDPRFKREEPVRPRDWKGDPLD